MGVSRDQTECPTPAWINLRQAVLWAGPHLPPLESRFEELERYPRSIDNPTWAALGLEDEFDNVIEEGKKKIAEVLMLGKLVAEGRKGSEEVGADEGVGLDENAEFPADGEHYFVVYEDSFGPIPAEVWRVHAIDWDRSSLRLRRRGILGGSAVEYGDVRIQYRDLLRIFPDPSAQLAKSSGTGRRRGRPIVYDQHQFWMLCALEAAAHGLPSRKADFQRRMGELWSLVIGDPVPERNWFSNRFDEIEKMRAAYESRGELSGEM